MFAVSTEQESKLLIDRARQAGVMGYSAAPQYVGVAVELAQTQDLDRLAAFSRQLHELHDQLVAEGLCECDDAWFDRWVAEQPEYETVECPSCFEEFDDEDELAMHRVECDR